MTISSVAGQDRPRRKSILRFLSYWRIALAALALVALVLSAALSRRRTLDVLAASVVGAVGVGVGMHLRARRV